MWTQAVVRSTTDEDAVRLERYQQQTTVAQSKGEPAPQRPELTSDQYEQNFIFDIVVITTYSCFFALLSAAFNVLAMKEFYSEEKGLTPSD
jgi:hypothetical protein